MIDEAQVRVRPMTVEDLDEADRVMRLAFATIRGHPDPATAFGEARAGCVGQNRSMVGNAAVAARQLAR